MIEGPDNSFYRQLQKNFRLTTIQIVYRLPDYHSILQEFLWQTLDHPPKFPRMQEFINYWIENIEGPIYSVQIANTSVISPNNFRSVSKYYEIKNKEGKW